MAVEVNVQENWVIEPELADQPPRRFAESGYPDYNKPNPMVLYGAGGAGALVGLILIVVGLSGTVLLAVLGIVLLLGGAYVAAILAPQMIKRYSDRAEHLIKSGVPVMARILTSDNTSGDNSDRRALRYQISLPNGEMVHKQVNADDRVLPKRIPANVTALMDISSGDVELYCALPYRAVAKNQAAARKPVDPLTPTIAEPTPTPATGAVNPGRMGTIEVENAPKTERPKPKAEEAPAQEEKTSGTAGLPWE